MSESRLPQERHRCFISAMALTGLNFTCEISVSLVMTVAVFVIVLVVVIVPRPYARHSCSCSWSCSSSILIEFSELNALRSLDRDKRGILTTPVKHPGPSAPCQLGVHQKISFLNGFISLVDAPNLWGSVPAGTRQVISAYPATFFAKSYMG